MQRPPSARYLLRFDDLCPAMNWEVWSEIEAALIEHEINPMLAVVPDNQDPMLDVQPAVDDFWDRVRGWQARGWTIGLHGFQHKYTAERAGIVTPRKKTEFAGFPAAVQEEKLRNGMAILRREGITPRVWIAPNNSFDGVTVSLLPRFGIHVVCDGCFRFPFVDRGNMTWVPQQLFGFRPAPTGVWTVCYHHNNWTASQTRKFREDLNEYGPNIGSLEDILNASDPRGRKWSAWLCTHPRFSRLLIRAELKLWNWGVDRSRTHGPDMKTVELPR